MEMIVSSFKLDPELKKKAMDRAKEKGHPSFSEYIRNLIINDLEKAEGGGG